MSAKPDKTTVTLQLSAPLAERLSALSAELGGPDAVVERALLMAPVDARRALLRGPVRRDRQFTVLLSRDEYELVEQLSAAMNMSKAQWGRAVLCARLRRQPQLTQKELLANSAVRVQLLRIIDRLQRAADEGDNAAVVACWRDARRALEALRAAMVGNLLYWSPLDD